MSVDVPPLSFFSAPTRLQFTLFSVADRQWDWVSQRPIPYKHTCWKTMLTS